MSRQRLHHGNSSGEEEQEGLLTTRIGSKHFQFSDEGRKRKISKKSKGKKGQVSFFTMYCTLISFSGAIILTIVGIYMSSNSRFFVIGGPEMEKDRATKATHVFLAAALYLCIGIYCSYKWKNGKAKSSVSSVGRIN